MKRLLLFALLTATTIHSHAQLVINELMQSNIDCVMDDLNDFPDSWVELYNSGITDISALSGHQNLKDVNLTGNQIGDMSPLSSCPLLQYVHLSRNPCSEDAAQQDSLRSALPDTLFVFDESSATRGWNNTEHSLIVDRTIVSRHYYDIDQGIVGID